MRADLYRASVVCAGMIALVSCAFVVPVAGAADQPAGAAGSQSQQEMKKEQPQVPRDIVAPGELGKGHERPMKMPDWIQISPSDDYSHLLNLDFKGQVPDILERTWEDDAKSAVSY